MELPMAIVWREEMSVDGGVIDADHKALIALVNDVDLVGPGTAMPAQLMAILGRLGSYARTHFDREQRLQLATGFTFAQAHEARHRGLLRELDAMCAECESGPPGQIEAFHARLRDFLHNWLVDHIIKADLLMKPFVPRMQRHAQDTVGLAEAVRLSEGGMAPDPAKSQRQLPLPAAAPRR
jgi:hemerythrin